MIDIDSQALASIYLAELALFVASGWFFSLSRRYYDELNMELDKKEYARFLKEKAPEDPRAAESLRALKHANRLFLLFCTTTSVVGGYHLSIGSWPG